jgi:hypothetical protein
MEVLVSERCFLVAIRERDVLCFVQVIGISNFGTVAISLEAAGGQGFFFAPLNSEAGCLRAGWHEHVI